MNVPNAITLLRVFLVPAILIAILEGAMAAAFALFLLAGLSDLLDGFLARLLQQQTTIGRFLDPLADKLLMTVSFIALGARGFLPAWLAVVVVSKDVLVALGAGIQYFLGLQAMIAPSRWGKSTTFLQAVTIGLVLLDAIQVGWSFPEALFFLTGGVTIVTGLLYILLGFSALPRDGEPSARSQKPSA